MKSQVQKFLDLTGFSTEYATTAAPLSDLTKKSAPNLVEWNPQCNSVFQALKTHLCSSPILNSPENPFILQIDASNRGVGAVLSQLDASGYDHPVAYFSTKLLPREERYSTIEKKFLVIKFGVQAFQVYLLG